MIQDKNLHQELLALLISVCGNDCFLENPSVDLLESGTLDSLARVEFLDALEDRFGTAPQPTRIPPEAWRRAETLLSFCESYYASSGCGSGVS